MTESAIFVVAVKLHSSKTRAAYLDEACAGDHELRRHVEELLQLHDQHGNLLEPPMPSPGKTVAGNPANESAGSLLLGPQLGGETVGTLLAGRYKLLQQIGEGGMGSVFMAEQTLPVKRMVAVKIIKPGMDSKSVLARFEAERQALAVMDHPNIAKILDANMTAGDRPFFVMELVKGIPITSYCDQECLTPEERLGLFIQVCRAVQHAHQKGLIHRDLKPSNVLVALYDGKPVPKVIDFGVAKATQHRLTEKTMFTELGQIIGTLEYMSPEQAELNNLDIDTRADIYSLGALLYELLTGSPPFTREQLHSAMYSEMLRIIREVEPQKPSAKLSSSEKLPGIAAHRKLEAKRLTKQIQGELDWIVLKALEKNRTHRYETANALAEDIQRYLHREAVLAGPPSTTYKLRKFVHRHRGAVLAGVLLIATLVAGVAGTLVGLIQANAARTAEAKSRQEAQTEAEISREIARFLQYDILGQAGAREEADQTLTLRTALDRAARRIAGRFDQQPLVEAAIQLTIAESYGALGDHDAAQPHVQRAFDLRVRELGEANPETLDAMNELALTLHHQGQFAEAEPLYIKALALRRQVLGESHLQTLNSMNHLAVLYRKQRKYDEALALHTRALDIYRREWGEDHPNIPRSLHNLAMLYQDQGKSDLAEPLLVKALEVHRRQMGDDDPATFTMMTNLAAFYEAQRRYGEAESFYIRALEGRRRVLKEDHPDTLASMYNLADLHELQGKFAEAARLYAKGLALAPQVVGKDHPWNIDFKENLARMYLAQNKYADAEPLLQECLKARQMKSADDWTTYQSMSLVGASVLGQRKYEQAEPLLLQGYEGMKRRESQIPSDSINRLTEAIERLVQLYEVWGKPEKCKEWQKKLQTAKAASKDSKP